MDALLCFHVYLHVPEHACRLSLEGIVSKLANAAYRPGRGRDWLKSKCSARQEFVIAGYVPSTATANAIGSLVMGVYDGKRLEHVGRVGTGHRKAFAPQGGTLDPPLFGDGCGGALGECCRFAS